MASFKTYPVFYSIVAVLGLAAAAGGYGIYDRSTAAAKSAKVVVAKRSELSSLLGSTPAPTKESKAAVEADLRRTEVALATMREELKGQGPTAAALRAAAVPAEPTDAFFNIATFVEKTREKAEAAKIKIKADERFSFSTYSSAGPDRELIPQVFRQRQVAEYLVDALIAARPIELISVQRERPMTKADLAAIASGQPQNAARSGGAGTQGSTDLFEIDPRITARVPGFVGASAFRLTFNGETESLRSFLNKLATFELPLVVRSVEVEPIAKSTTAAAAAPANSLSSIFGTVATPATAEPVKPKPLVEKNQSKFTVTVELIDLVVAPASEATPTN
ncbi:MAG: hypothetical protein ACAH89_01460 [Rariglobus sp.]|nr:Amuc_1100 family pilus-like protein [Rariglobus sp.]